MSVKKCSKCGNDFGCCNETPGCWCEELFIDMETLKQLKQEFDNCLCRECLQGYAQKKAD